MIETTFVLTPRAQAVTPDLTGQMASPTLVVPNHGDLIQLPGTDLRFVVCSRHIDYSQAASVRIKLLLDLAGNQ